MRASGAPTVASADLSDDEWPILETLLPVAIRGRQALHLQRHVDGIRHRARVGCPSRDVPERYRARQSLYRVFRGYQLKGGVVAGQRAVTGDG